MQIGLTSYSLGNSLPVLPKQVAAILRKYGSDAHLYMPGPGVPVLGPDKTPAGTSWLGFNANLSSATLPATATQTGSVNYGLRLLSFLTIGKEYKVTVSWSGNSSGRAIKVDAAGATNLGTSASGTASATFKATDVAHYIYAAGAAGGESFTINSVLTEEITGYTNQVSGFTTGNYLESTGNTNAVVDGAVGLVLDAAGSVGADVYPSGLAGASVSGGASVAGAVASLPNASAQVGAVGYAAVAGTTYRVTFDVVSSTGSYLNVYIGSAGMFGVVSGAFTGRKTVHIKANNATGLIFQNDSGAVGGIPSITLVECKPVTGIHATQATTANKPTVRRGIVNLLTYSNDLTNGVWNVAAVSKTVNRITPDATSALHRVFHGSITIVSGAPYTSAVVAKADGYRYLYVNGAASGGKGQVCFDLQTGTVAATAEGVGTIAATGDGSYLCCVSSTSASTSNVLYLQVNNSANASDTTFAGDGTSGIYCYASGLFQGTLTAQQIIAAGGIPLTTTAAASSASGPYYLQHDGTDDRLLLGSVPFQFADDWCCVYAGRVDSLSALRALFGAYSSTQNNPRMQAYVAATTGQVFMQVRDDTGVAVFPYIGTAVVGQPFVVTIVKRGSSVFMRFNGTQSASASTASLGTLTVDTFAIGETKGAFHHGATHYCLPIKGTVPDADIKTFEKFAAQLAEAEIV